MSELLDALFDTLGVAQDADDLTDMEIAFDRFATKLLRAKIVTRRSLQNASKLSDVLAVFQELANLPEEAVKAAYTVESCVSQGNYGAFHEGVIQEAQGALEALVGLLEEWLTEVES